MSRVIKFRAWNKTNKKMIDRVLAGPGDPCSIVWDEERKDWVQFDELCGELMQFTGLKDCSGQEIYEGDLVKATIEATEESHYGDDFERGYWIGQVVYQEAGFHLKQTNDPYSPMLTNICIASLEVLGNIYETPEQDA